MTSQAKTAKPRFNYIDNLNLIVTPIFAAILIILAATVWNYSEFDQTTENILRPSLLISQLWETILIGILSSLIVIAVAVPLGITITRRGYPGLKTFLVDSLGLAQALPAYGLIVVFYTFLGTGMPTAIYALALFSLLPVLRNTIVGLEQVDRSVIDAGRGMGYTNLQILFKIELPLAIPIIIAGIRTAVVINVGMAALAFLVGAGGLGETINSGLKLNRPTAIFIGASLVAILALVLDFIGALAEKYLKPKGI